MGPHLDDVDRGILYLLQGDARTTTSREIAERVGVSASTVRNRIDRLERDGVIEGYHPAIDYAAANLPFRVMVVITAPATERSAMVDRLVDVEGVIEVRELLTGRRNIHAEVVGTSSDDIVRITDAIHDMGLEVERSEILKQRRMQPINHGYFSESIEEVERTEDGSDGD